MLELKKKKLKKVDKMRKIDPKFCFKMFFFSKILLGQI